MPSSCPLPDKSTAPVISCISIKLLKSGPISYKKLTSSEIVPFLSTGYKTVPFAFILISSVKTASLKVRVIGIFSPKQYTPVGASLPIGSGFILSSKFI